MPAETRRRIRSIEGLRQGQVAWFVCAECCRRVVVRPFPLPARMSHQELAELVLEHHGEPPMCDECHGSFE